MGFVSVAAVASAAVPGTPGVPQDPTTVWIEDFENRPNESVEATTPTYVGKSGTTYDADAFWKSRKNCNGIVLNYNNSREAGDCTFRVASAGAWHTAIRGLARRIGVHNGTDPPEANSALTAFTAGNPPAGEDLQLLTSAIKNPGGPKRFIGFGVTTAAVNCGVAAPIYQFNLLDGTTAIPVGGRVNACDGQTNNVASHMTDAGILFGGSSLRIQMLNKQPTGTGNDGAIDDLKIVDVTPQLDKAFERATATTGDSVALTFTVTNTSELGAKKGWSFTDNLPAGLKIAAPAANTTCASGAVTAPAGGTTIAASGDLNEGRKSCTVTVHVTSDAAGTYTNGPGNIEPPPTGLNPPGKTTVTFRDPVGLAITKTADKTAYLPGDKVTFTVTMTNSGPADARGATVSDTLPPGLAGVTWTCKAGAGGSCTAAGKGNIKDTVTVPKGGRLTYTITGTVSDDATGPIVNTAIATPPPGIPDPKCTPNCSTEVTVPPAPVRPGISVVKSAEPDRVFRAGDTTTYSYLVTNTGNVTLKNVTVTETQFTGTGTRPRITCPAGAASLAPGASLTCQATYTFTAKDVAAGEVRNTATATGRPPGNHPPPTSPPSTAKVAVPKLAINKSVSPTGAAKPGETVTYTIAVRNTGAVDYPNAKVADDLSGVLDDAAFAGGQSTSGELGFSAPKLNWTGDVPVGRTVTVTYTVKINDPDKGDLVLRNAVAGPPGSNCRPGSGDPGCAAPPVRVPRLKVLKSATPDRPVRGGPISYTVTVTNTGKGDYRGAALTDDLTDVLDDATYNNDARATSGWVRYARPGITWTGDVAVGATVQITYSVTVTYPPSGDGRFVNGVIVNGPGSNCPPGSTDPACSTVRPVPHFDLGDAPDTYRTKRASAGPVHQIHPALALGDKVESDHDGSPHHEAEADPGDDAVAGFPKLYSHAGDYDLVVKVRNESGEPARLGAWIDFDRDGAFDRDEGVHATVAPGTTRVPLHWSNGLGKMRPGRTYVRIRLFKAQESDRAPAARPAAGSSLRVGGPSPASTDPMAYGYGGWGEIEDHDLFIHPQPLKIAKTVSPRMPKPGGTVKYTVKITNPGPEDYKGAVVTDNLAKVLDDAALRRMTASSGRARYRAPVLTWKGDIRTGRTVTIGYSLRLGRHSGDGSLRNKVVGPAGSNCRPGGHDPACRTRATLGPPVPEKPTLRSREH